MANIFDNTSIQPLSMAEVQAQFAVDLNASSGLNVSILGGNAFVAGVLTVIAETVLTLTANATNYVIFNPSTGAIAVSTSPPTSGGVSLYSMVTDASAVTSVTDMRVCFYPLMSQLPIPYINGNGTVVVPMQSTNKTAGQSVGLFNFVGEDSSSLVTGYAQIAGNIVDPTNPVEYGGIQFNVIQAGTLTDTMALRQGLTVGNNSVADKGFGTINTSGGVYLNGTAFTNPDYVFEKAYQGKVTKFANNEGASTYIQRSLDEMEMYTRINLALPSFGQSAQLDYLRGSEQLLARLEDAYLYIFQLDKRLKRLEG